MTVIPTLRRAAVSLALLAALCAAVAGCAKIRPLTAPPVERGSADFGIYVAMGANLTAGFQSGGLAQRHQVLSYANLFAGQAGTPRFTFPAVNLGGWPPLLKVASFGPPVVLDSAGVRGAFINPLRSPPAVLDSAYHNMGIPGALLADVLDPFLNYNIGLGRDASFFFNIARQQGRPIPLSLLQLVRNKRPTFVSFEYGVNELLGPAVRGSSAITMPAGPWASLLHVTLDSMDINLPLAKKLILNVPDVTRLPFFNTVPPVELTATGTPVIVAGVPTFLTGTGGLLQPGDLVTLSAVDSLKIGVGYQLGDISYMSGAPVPGNGRPLPDRFVLTAAEQTTLKTAVNGYNAAIANEATARGYALVDLRGLLDGIITNGFKFAGVNYSAAYLTGGLFSVDGIHPTDLVHGLICNAMSDAVLEKFGARIPALDLARLRTASSSSLSRARRSEAPGFMAAAIPLWRLGTPTGMP
ncbi:MAG: hypothetical protein ABIS67_14325 [Candidatus Eisenbacteria bacterium]